MAKKKKQERTKRTFGQDLVFVLNNLSNERLEHADEIYPTPVDIMEFCHRLVDNGIDLKLSWDTYSNCYQATAIGIWNDFPSAGRAVSARSNRDSTDALALLWYKVAIICEYNLSSVPTETEIDDLRG